MTAAARAKTGVATATGAAGATVQQQQGQPGQQGQQQAQQGQHLGAAEGGSNSSSRQAGDGWSGNRYILQTDQFIIFGNFDGRMADMTNLDGRMADMANLDGRMAGMANLDGGMADMINLNGRMADMFPSWMSSYTISRHASFVAGQDWPDRPGDLDRRN